MPQNGWFSGVITLPNGLFHAFTGGIYPWDRPLATARPANKEPTDATLAQAVNAPVAVGENTVEANNRTRATDVQTQNETDANLVKRIVDEVVALMSEIHEGREELMARGIPFHNINALVESGVHNKREDMSAMCKTAIAASQKQYGAAGITSELLDELLGNLVTLEKELRYVRAQGRQQGLDMDAINYLTMMIRQNPGDGGDKMLNTFLAYILACDMPLHHFDEVLAQTRAEAESILPADDSDDDSDLKAVATKRLITDVCVGCVLAVLSFALLT